jgi:hypothetical protein
MTKIISLVPHQIHLIGQEGQTIRTFEPSGQVARVSVETVKAKVDELSDLPITHQKFGDVTGLPKQETYCLGGIDPHEHQVYCGCDQGGGGIARYYIVSAMVKAALPKRRDLLVPSDFVRDEKGQILGCKSLSI